MKNLSKQEVMTVLSQRTGIEFKYDPYFAVAVMGRRGLESEAAYLNPDRLTEQDHPLVQSYRVFQKELILAGPNSMSPACSFEKFFGSMVHELAHSTGRRVRLNRPAINTPVWQRSMLAYIAEEITAETTALRILEELGIATDEYRGLVAAYIKDYEDGARQNNLEAQLNDIRSIIETDIENAKKYILDNWIKPEDFAAEKAA